MRFSVEFPPPKAEFDASDQLCRKLHINRHRPALREDFGLAIEDANRDSRIRFKDDSWEGISEFFNLLNPAQIKDPRESRTIHPIPPIPLSSDHDASVLIFQEF